MRRAAAEPKFWHGGAGASCSVFGQPWTGTVYMTNGKSADIAQALKAAAKCGTEDLYVRLSTEAGAACDCGACLFTYGYSAYEGKDVWSTACFPGRGGYLSPAVCEKACELANGGAQ